MVVAILCQSKGHGGLELYARREHQELESRGFHCISIVTKNSMLGNQLEEQSLKHNYLDVSNRRLPLLAAKKLAAILDHNKVDVLHMHWNKDLNLAVLAKVFATRNIKLVYSRHMDITRNKHDFLHRWFYKRVDKLLVISKRLQQDCEKFLPLQHDKIQLLYLGVAAPKNNHVNCGIFFKDKDFEHRRLNLACFGRVEPYKGQHILLSALSILKKEGLDISATIVGHIMDQSYAETLKENLDSAELSSHVQFKEFVTDPIELMRCFEIVVLTTYCETFGLVLAEAMRAGVAVIGTNAGGVPDIIEHNKSGLLIEPGSPELLAQAIKQLYEDPLKLDRLSSQGKARADEHFAEKTHFDKLKSILSELTA